MPSEADREKHSVAFTSACAAVLLTSAKLAIGLWTNSLGILSEAAHSGLDLLAAAMTLWAVTVSGRPADEGHAYGHGKAENLSALLETVLLLATCAWIIWEALERLFLRPTSVQVNAWSFVVVLVSIAVDYSRSRALKAAAVKYRSQALEADALHFSTDIWSSCVVLAGLCGVLAAQRYRLPWLARADSAAALGVAAIVAWICSALGRRSVGDLLDAAPKELQQRIAAASAVEGVTEVRQVRVRRSGPAVFADVVIAVGPDAAIERAHEISERAEQSVRQAVAGADVIVHVEPGAGSGEPLTMARALAARFGLGAHGARLYEERGQLSLELHVEVAEGLALGEAHRLVTEFESELRRAVPGLSAVVSHIEPAGEHRRQKPSPAGERRVRDSLSRFVLAEKVDLVPHELKVRATDGELALSLHCELSAQTPLRAAHDLTVRLEKHLRSSVPELGRVVIHVEPPGAR